MNRLEKRLALIAVILAIVAAGIAGATLLSGSPRQTDTRNSFIAEPVLDIIIPSLFHETSTGGINSPLNASAGQALSLTVQLFPTTNLNVSMQFRYFVMNSSSSVGNTSSNLYVSAIFHPQDLTIAGGKTANVTMQLAISTNAKKGDYTSVISAVNLQNSSQVWGVIMQINIV